MEERKEEFNEKFEGEWIKIEEVVDKRFDSRNEETMNELKKQIKDKRNIRGKEWEDRKEEINGKFEEIKKLWKEAEWVINEIKYEKEEVERIIKIEKEVEELEKERVEDKKRIYSLESEVRRRKEEIEIWEKFREELEGLTTASL